MSDPRSRGRSWLCFLSPTYVMVATAGLVFLSLADYRVDLAAELSTSPLQLQVVEALASAGPEAAGDPGIALALAMPAPLQQRATATVTAATSAPPRDRLVVAAIGPKKPLVEVLAPVLARETGHRESQSPAIVTAALLGKEPRATDTVAPRADWEGDAFVGPPWPAEAETAASDATPELAAPTTAADRALPFDPLREPAIVSDEADKSSTAESARKMQALIPADEEHTVRYVREVLHEVRSGETLSSVLAKQGLKTTEAEKWLQAVRSVHNPNKIYAGQTLSLLLDMPEKRLRRVRLEIAKGMTLLVEDKGEEIVARRQEAPLERSVQVVEGVISSSLYEVALAKGVPDRVISDAAEVLGWEINLGRDLRPGARFRLVYEENVRTDTHESWAGKLLAIELNNSGKHYEGLYFAQPDGSSHGYYNRKGEGLGRQFLRYPVSFSRISSHFTTARYHPVLKRKMPHYGVDFAAPTGTPIKAVADGVVRIAGWNGGNGRFVKVRHDSQYETGYAHLSRIASGLRPGSRVRQGQVVGYVGSTGLATGPHLHFAMYRYGKYVDPLKASLPRTSPLGGSALASFKAKVKQIEEIYAERGMAPFGATKVTTAASSGSLLR